MNCATTVTFTVTFPRPSDAVRPEGAVSNVWNNLHIYIQSNIPIRPPTDRPTQPPAAEQVLMASTWTKGAGSAVLEGAGHNSTPSMQQPAPAPQWPNQVVCKYHE